MSAKHLTKFSLAALAAGAAIAIAAPAQADEGSFIAHVHALGFNAPAGDHILIDAGNGLCDALNRGASLGMVQAVAENQLTPKGYTISDADRFVAYSISDLC